MPVRPYTYDDTDSIVEERNHKQVLVRNSKVETCSVQWDGEWYHLAPNQVQRMPDYLAQQFMKNHPEWVKEVTGEEGTVLWAKSRLEQAKRQLSEAQSIMARAKENVDKCEREVKVAEARVESESSPRDDGPTPRPPRPPR